jgi:hypothetical protein
MPDDLYARQALVPGIAPPQKAIVIGCGGVGSYVAIFLAMTGVKELVLIDPDEVEESNRGRVLFQNWDVGDLKVHAVMNFIYGIRKDISITTFPIRAEEIPEAARPMMKGGMLFDCRDNITPLPDYYPKCCITGGYNGTRITLHTNPVLEDVFSATDGPVRYQVTPSYCIPPAIIGALCVYYGTTPSVYTDKEHVTTLDIGELFVSMFMGAPRSD